MPIENRNLNIGTKLTARYKKQVYHAEVIGGEGEKLLYRLEDGREWGSPSAAGSALMNGRSPALRKTTRVPPDPVKALPLWRPNWSDWPARRPSGWPSEWPS